MYDVSREAGLTNAARIVLRVEKDMWKSITCMQVYADGLLAGPVFVAGENPRVLICLEYYHVCNHRWGAMVENSQKKWTDRIREHRGAGSRVCRGN